MNAPQDALVRAEGITRAFHRRGGLFSRGTPMLALRGVDIAVKRGEAVGVVGESGWNRDRRRAGDRLRRPRPAGEILPHG